MENFDLPGQAVVYLARHAAPDRSRKDLTYHLPPGPPLTSQGIAEAHELAQFAYSAGVKNIISSPLERCRHTAEIISQLNAAPVEVDKRLIELLPDEGYASVLKRVWPVFEAATQASLQAGPVVLLTHGGVVSVLLLALGMSSDLLSAQCVFDYNNPVHTAGAWQASRNISDGGWRLRLAFTPQAVVEPAQAD